MRSILMGLLACAILMLGCSTSSEQCTQGSERCSCYPNNTCDSGLACLSGLCVQDSVSDGDMENSDVELDSQDTDTQVCIDDPLCEDSHAANHDLCDQCGGGKGAWGTPNFAYRSVCAYSNSVDGKKTCTASSEITNDHQLPIGCVQDPNKQSSYTVSFVGPDHTSTYAFQCVELVRRYLAQVYGLYYSERLNACELWGSPASLGTRYSNGGTEAPKEGDLLIFYDVTDAQPGKLVCDQGGEMHGHIAIITKVYLPSDNPGRVVAIDQNRTSDGAPLDNLALTQDADEKWQLESYSRYYGIKGWIRVPATAQSASCGVRGGVYDAENDETVFQLIGCPDNAFCAMGDELDPEGECIPYADTQCMNDNECPGGTECRGGACVCSNTRVNESTSFDFSVSSHCFRCLGFGETPWVAEADGCSCSTGVIAASNTYDRGGLLLRDMDINDPSIVSPPLDIIKSGGMKIVVHASGKDLSVDSAMMKLYLSKTQNQKEPAFTFIGQKTFLCNGSDQSVEFTLDSVSGLSDGDHIRRLQIEVTDGENGGIESAELMLHNITVLDGTTECAAGSDPCCDADGNWTVVGKAGPRCNGNGCQTCELGGTGRVCENRQDNTSCGETGVCNDGQCTERACIPNEDICCDNSGSWVAQGSNGYRCDGECEMCNGEDPSACEPRADGIECNNRYGRCANGQCDDWPQCRPDYDTCCQDNGYWVTAGQKDDTCNDECRECNGSHSCVPVDEGTSCTGGKCDSQGNCEGCQCSSGVCCDGCSFKNSTNICQSDAEVEYGCPDGTGCGDPISRRYQDRYCSGDSSSCNGQLGAPRTWQQYASCQDYQVCEPGKDSCQDNRQLCCECTSGDCCENGCDFKNSNEVCDTHVQSQYVCPSTSCGSDVYIEYQDRYCSGNSASCNGSLSGWTDRSVADYCDDDEKCVGGNSSCTYDNSCACDCSSGDTCCSNGCDWDSYGSPCGESDSCSSYGSCNYSDTCDEQATKYRTCYPRVCSSSHSCTNGSSYQDSASCSRSTDGDSCTLSGGGSAECDNGDCVSNLTAVPTCPTYTSVAAYNCHGGSDSKIFKICATVDDEGMVTVKTKKDPSSSVPFSNRPYQVREFGNSISTSQQCKYWNAVKADSPSGIGTTTLTFEKFDPIISSAGVDAYCVTASTISSDGGYDPSDPEQEAWWCSGKLLIKIP